MKTRTAEDFMEFYVGRVRLMRLVSPDASKDEILQKIINSNREIGSEEQDTPEFASGVEQHIREKFEQAWEESEHPNYKN